jgi:uncharacterized Fe-S cluster-containing radical SAM superfamily protein
MCRGGVGVTGPTVIDTDAYSARLRSMAIRLDRGELLVADFVGSGQEADLSEPANCHGIGRIRHFHRSTSPGWPENPLPIDPAAAFLGIEAGDQIRAQVFQNAACNWRCWYCFVPFDLLGGKKGTWVTPHELVHRYAAVGDRPPMIDLTGGQPDLVPEWIPWMMDAVEAARLQDSVYLWSDDNLSNDYFWRYLDDRTRERMAEYRGYGRVCCFKGFDARSFAFNTAAAPELFDRQFDLFSQLLTSGLDVYAYATFTGPISDGMGKAMRRFVDRLQRIAEPLPLRVVPLEISEYRPVTPRLNADRSASLSVQVAAIEVWNAELERRFTTEERTRPITAIPVGAWR